MRLLLAEDEVDLSNALVAMLKHSNYEVDPVYNGQDALDYIESGEYDCAILDVMMPKMDGITVLKNIRRDGYDLPVLILTAKSEIEDRVTGLDAGADDYLTKPFAMKELIARVRAITRRAQDNCETVLKCGNLELDTATYMMSTETGSIRLQGKEYQMLEMLMQNPGQIISGERFLEKIWGLDSDAEINSIWVYLSNLRKKLNSLESTAAIKAVRGAGYTIEVTDIG